MGWRKQGVCSRVAMSGEVKDKKKKKYVLSNLGIIVGSSWIESGKKSSQPKIISHLAHMLRVLLPRHLIISSL